MADAELPEETVEVFLTRARLLADLEHWTEASEELARGRELDPRHVDLLILSAVVAVHGGQATAALSYAETATAAAPVEHEEALVVRAWVLASMSDLSGGLAYAEELAGRFPDVASPMMVASALFSVVGGGQRALDTAWAAVRLAPMDPDAHWSLSQIAARMGLTELARDSVREARRLEPLPGRRSGVWSLWWRRFGGVEAMPSATATRSDWVPIVKIAAVVVVIGLLLAWIAAG